MSPYTDLANHSPRGSTPSWQLPRSAAIPEAPPPFLAHTTSTKRGVRRCRHVDEIKASELREKYVHAHAVALEAIGRTGNALLRERPETWKANLARLATLDWSRASPPWQGRVLVNGRVSKTAASAVLTANALKMHLGLELGVEDRRVEGLYEARR